MFLQDDDFMIRIENICLSKAEKKPPHFPHKFEENDQIFTRSKFVFPSLKSLNNPPVQNWISILKVNCIATISS